MSKAGRKLFVGHFLSNEHEWFAVYARSRRDALFIIDAATDEPDVRSVVEVTEEFVVHFRARLVLEDDEAALAFTPPRSHGKPEEAIRLDESGVLREWIETRLRHAAGEADALDNRPTAKKLGIDQPEVMQSYLSDSNVEPEEEE